MLVKLVIIAASFLLVRSIYYGYYWFVTKRYEKVYIHFIQDGKPAKLRYLKTQIKRAIKVANVTTYEIPAVEPMGWGQLASYKISPFDNITNRRQDVVEVIMEVFLDAIGTLRAKSLESFNPVYWVELVVFLPSKFLGYLGADPRNGAVRLLQVVWWLVAAVSTVAGILFNEQFMHWVGRL